MRNLFKPLALLTALLLASCSNKQEEKATAVAHMPLLDLGKPGETTASADLSPAAVTHKLEANEEIRFIDDKGAVEILHRRGRTFKVGDMIVGNEKQRLLLKVKEVRTIGAANSTLLTQLGMMTDLLNPERNSMVKIETTPVFTTSDLQKPEAEKSGRLEVDDQGQVVMENVEIFDLNFDDKAGLKFGLNKILGVPVDSLRDKLNVSGVAAGRYRAVINKATVHVVPTFRNHYRWSGLKPEELYSKIDAQLKYRMDVTYDVAGKVELTALFDLFKKKLVTVVVPAGNVPVYVDIELALPIGITLNADAKGSVRVVYEAEYAFTSELRYTESAGVKATGDQGAQVLRHEMSSESGQLNLSGELFLQPEVTARFYRVLGPQAYLQPYVRAEWEANPTAGKKDLFAGVGGGVGLEVSEPLLLTQLFSLDSGRIFNFHDGWDLMGGSGAPKEKSPYEVASNQTLNKLTNEGFVVLDFSSSSLPPGTRFLLDSGAKQGFVVPSQNFFLDGKLFYYPNAKADEDYLKVSFLLPDGSKDSREVKLSVSAEVKAKAGEEKFSRSSNSVAAAYGHPREFQDKVPHHGFVYGGIRSFVPPEMEKFLRKTEILRSKALAINATPEQIRLGEIENHSRFNQERDQQSARANFLTEAKLFTESSYSHFRKLPGGIVAIECQFKMNKARAPKEQSSKNPGASWLGITDNCGMLFRNSGYEQTSSILPLPKILRIAADGSEKPLEVFFPNWERSSIVFEELHPEEDVTYRLYFEANPKWTEGFFYAPAMEFTTERSGVNFRTER